MRFIHRAIEVDFLVPLGDRKLRLLEVKASGMVTPNMALPLDRFGRAVRKKYSLEKFLVYRPRAGSRPGGSVLRPGVRAVSLPELLGLEIKEKKTQAKVTTAFIDKVRKGQI